MHSRGWRLTALAAATSLLVPAIPVFGQQPDSPDLTIRTTVQQVLLDFVVRDRAQKIVKTIRQEDIEVYEDGVKQDIKSFRFVGGEAGRLEEQQADAAKRTAGQAPNQQLRELNLVCFVFGLLSPDTRAYARDAAAEFLKTEMRDNTFAAVFSLGYRLNALERFTNDTVKLRAAIDKAASGQYSQFAGDTARVTREAQQLQTTAAFQGVAALGPQVAQTNGVRTTSYLGAATDTSAGGDPVLAGLLLGILFKTQEFTQNTSGTANLLALQDMATQLGKLPGRKTVILLTEGLVVNPNQLEILRNAISVANRNNVSVYGVDVNGLNPIRSGGLQRTVIPTVTRAANGEIATNDNIQTVDAADVVRDNIQENLRDLSESTGGFLIANTNDFRKTITRIVEDVNTHYEVTYTPTGTTMDGHFRKVEVKLKRGSGLKLQSRSGYFALPSIPGQTVMTYEAGLLKALDTTPRPRGLAFSSNTYRFRPGAVTQVVTAFETSAAGLTWQAAENKQASAHLSIMALVRDEGGQVVDKLTRDLPFTVPADRVKDYQQISITQMLQLPPGRYTVDWAASDRNSGKIGTKRQVLVIPRVGGLTMSQVVVGRRVDPVSGEGAADANQTDPLIFVNNKVTPSVTAEFDRATRKEIPLYFILYPPADGVGTPELRIDILHDGKLVNSANPPIPKPTVDGALPFLALIPTGGLDAGQYEIRITATQGQLAAQETALVNII